MFLEREQRENIIAPPYQIRITLITNQNSPKSEKYCSSLIKKNITLNYYSHHRIRNKYEILFHRSLSVTIKTAQFLNTLLFPCYFKA
jgi:hypothetical protein